MTPTLRRKAKKFDCLPAYACPQCGASFERGTADDEWKINVHRILHIGNSSERWKLLDELIATQEGRSRPVAN